jgi:hypothetical protein
MDVVKSALFLSTLFLVSCGPAPDMPVYQAATVELLDANDEKNFYLLPLKGELLNGEKNWSGDYWALNKGTINYRWNSPPPTGFDYISPTREELALMSPELIAELSPSEKFDLLQGRYDYPLKEEASTRADRLAMDGDNLVNGWAPASMNHNEPTPKTIMNPDSIEIRFGSSDIKAILSYYYSYEHKAKNIRQLGRHCPEGDWFNWKLECQNNLNAGSFHVVMANKVGKRNEGFVVDVDHGKEVWNHPILAYSSRVESSSRAEASSPPGTVKILNVRSRVTYVDESAENTWEPIRGTVDQSLVRREYRYDLFLDLKNNIIGGEWKSEERPDFLWLMGPAESFTGHFSVLKTLLKD